MRRENDARVALVEENNKKSTERLHLRIDECDKERERQHLEMADLRRENNALVKRMERLEEGERRLLERTPAPGQGVTIMPMPVQTP
mgnify:CR=1 FL=1